MQNKENEREEIEREVSFEEDEKAEVISDWDQDSARISDPVEVIGNRS